jgi:hypothetical protein
MIHMGNAVEERRFGAKFAISQGDRIQRLQTESAAETYFASPETPRGSTTAPNLFQPFWRARLIPINPMNTEQQSTKQ